MSMVSQADAPANTAPFPIDPAWDRRLNLSATERAALAELAVRFADRHRQWPPGAKAALDRLLVPVNAALEWLHAAQAPRNMAIHQLSSFMIERGTAYWAWRGDDWVNILCQSEGAYKARYGSSANCRQYVMAIAYLLCGFDQLSQIGRFFQYRLAIKVFGRAPVDEAAAVVFSEMESVGLSSITRRGVPHALYTALLIQRSPRLKDLTLDTLRKTSAFGPAFIRQGAASLSRALARLGMLERGFDHRVDDRRRSKGEYRATDEVPDIWLDWCERWRAIAPRAPSSVTSTYYVLLKCGRWLASEHPEAASPADWNRGVALDYVAAVAAMRIGDWANPGGMYLHTRGASLKPGAKAANLRSVRNFFRDLQEWEWIPVRFDPARALGVPRAINAAIGPNPRNLADDHWAKLVWAGLNLAEDDLPGRSEETGLRRQPVPYPILVVRALAIVWLFGGLRLDEMLRLRVGCARWQSVEGDTSRTCLLDVPVNKTATAFVKPVDALVGQVIEAWERERLPHPKMADRKEGGVVDYLFVCRGRRLPKAYVNKRLIPLLCKKAGVAREDARGRITSHRARATIASQLYNAKEPMSLFELQAWLGHASPQSTQHYIAVTPTKLSGALMRAGYFERNLRTIAVLVDGDAVRSGAAARGEPWRYYDLGHGLCTYDFFDQCPHRMACAKCSFYVPKTSTKAQALEASANLARMLQEIPLQDGERAAVEDGIDAMTKLVEGLRDTKTPDGRTPAKIVAENLGQGSIS
jgi:integrase